MGSVYSLAGCATDCRQGVEVVSDIGIFIVGCVVTVIWVIAIGFLIWGETKEDDAR